MFGSPPRTLCLLRFIPLPSTIPHGSVFSIFTSLAMQDDTMHPWYKGPCVIHSKLLSMNATKQDRVSYWTNNKDNQTRPGARFEHASHNPGLPLHSGSPSPKQPITPKVQRPIMSREVPERRKCDRTRSVDDDRTRQCVRSLRARSTVRTTRRIRSGRQERLVSSRKLGFAPNGYFLYGAYK